jgi:hypothetical protein
VQFRGDVECGWVSGNLGVFGGLMDGADPAFPDSYFTVMVSDGPDGIIIGNGRPQCGVDGFGDPGDRHISRARSSLSIAEGVRRDFRQDGSRDSLPGRLARTATSAATMAPAE